MSKPDFSSPAIIIAVGIAVAAILWGLAQLALPVFEGMGILIKAFGAAIGLVIAVGTTGLATAGTTAAWLAPTATVSVAIASIGVTYKVLHTVVNNAKDKPYECLLPILTMLAVVSVDLTKDALLSTTIERALYALATGLCTLGGGFLLLSDRRFIRAIGFLLPFIPSIAICALLVRQTEIDNILQELTKAGYAGAIGLTGTIVLGAATAILGIVFPKR